MCDHGVITSSGSNADFWIPYMQYKIDADNLRKTTLMAEMETVH